LNEELNKLKASKAILVEKNASNFDLINDKIRIVKSLINNNLKLE